jgi:hypothetical protein
MCERYEETTLIAEAQLVEPAGWGEVSNERAVNDRSSERVVDVDDELGELNVSVILDDAHGSSEV